MVMMRPFRALRPPVEKVAQVASVPYDVVNTPEARELAKGNPLSLLHVSRPEIDLPEGTDPHADEVYTRGLSSFERLIREVPLLTEDRDCLYVYLQKMGNHVQTGVVGCCSVDEYDADVIKKHEKTRKDKEDDRTRHIVTLRAQTGPVFLMHKPDRAIDELVAQIQTGKPLYDFVAPDGVAHTMWKVDEPAALAEAFGRLECSYIADGHHRAASASRARATLRGKKPQVSCCCCGGGRTDPVEADSFLAVMFPANQLQILPYNRVVKDLAGLTPAELLQKLGDALGAAPQPWSGAEPAPARSGQCRVYLAGKWYTLSLTPARAGETDPTARLDVSILMDRVLGPLLGIGDPRTDKRIDFVGGIRGTPELVKLVDGGQAAVAFAMFPTTVEQLMAVADANLLMPPKSTWFEPKLRSGLVIHRI
ncbi:MAG: DUF1015 domain-containing protein [Candidatus Riflebacteria bacterium]|nr:DUF1015 domain-containing protein [Candidatus Riflebacteria bacterium]